MYGAYRAASLTFHSRCLCGFRPGDVCEKSRRMKLDGEGKKPEMWSPILSTRPALRGDWPWLSAAPYAAQSHVAATLVASCHAAAATGAAEA